MSNNHKGRPLKNVTFPQSGQFDMDALEKLNPEVSRVTLQSKVNQEIERKTMVLSGMRKNIRGRSSKLFSIAS